MEIDETAIEKLIAEKLGIPANRIVRSSSTVRNAAIARTVLVDVVRRAASRANYDTNIHGSCIDPKTHRELQAMGCFCLAADQAVAFWITHPTYRRDPEGRLHCDDGPAIESDVGDWYLVHGVMVPKQVVLSPETITARHIDAEKNSEVQRVMIERWPGGWDRYLRTCGTLLERRRNERDMQWEELYDFRGRHLLSVCDPSTGRRYALGVPWRIKTCEEAQRWLSHGLDQRAVHRS